MRAVKTTCPYCGVGCGIDARAPAGGTVAIRGDRTHSANSGRLCSKGTHLGETLSLDERLLHPMIGERRAGWDEALDEVAARLQRTLAEHGPDSVAFYVSGQLLTEDYYVANKLAKGFVGTGNIDTNSRLCMASAVAAHQRAFGEDVVPCSYADIDCADLILLVGSNTAWCHPIVWQRIERAREQRGTRIVVIDPRRTQTASMADLHVPVRPDGDVGLFNALLAACVAEGLLDHDYLARNCEVPAGYLEALSSGDHGIDPAIFAALMQMVRDCPRMLTLFSQGVNQSVCGTDKANAIINLHLATGRIGRPGAGPFSITGQPNAMGGREVGGLATMLACHLGFSDDERGAVQRFWQAPRLCAGPGLKAVDMFRAVHDGRIRFIWIMATNPAVSMADAGLVREALARCPNVIVSDVTAQTDTARLAHIRLPALAWGEKDGTVTNSERRISRQRQFLPAPGEARADWRIICDVAARLGHGKAFDFASPAAIFREYAAMTGLSVQRGKRLDLTGRTGITDIEYDRMQPFQWGGRHPFAAGYPTPGGRARLVRVAPGEPMDSDSGLPFVLNTGRYRDQWHTMTRTGKSPRLAAHRREPLLEVSPLDASAHDLADHGFARIDTMAGSSLFRIAVTDAQRPGEVFVPMHWSDADSGSGRTGLLVHPSADPVSGQPGFKNIRAAVTPVRFAWRAFLLSREPVRPAVPYWIRSRIAGGWLCELAGDGAVEVERLLPAGQRTEVADLARGMRRMAVTGQDGAALALLYVTRTGELPAREWLIREFGESRATRAELLAGRSGTPQPDPGPLVCVCHDVGLHAISSAIGAGADSVAAIGQATCAGTNCGSCRPLIAELMNASRQSSLESVR